MAPIAGVDTSRLTSKVAGVILGLEVPFPLPEPNSCLLGAFCPIKYGDLNTISISLPILPIYPAVSPPSAFMLPNLFSTSVSSHLLVPISDQRHRQVEVARRTRPHCRLLHFASQARQVDAYHHKTVTFASYLLSMNKTTRENEKEKKFNF